MRAVKPLPAAKDAAAIATNTIATAGAIAAGLRVMAMLLSKRSVRRECVRSLLAATAPARGRHSTGVFALSPSTKPSSSEDRMSADKSIAFICFF
jgi:hypothetical protein